MSSPMLIHIHIVHHIYNMPSKTKNNGIIVNLAKSNTESKSVFNTLPFIFLPFSLKKTTYGIKYFWACN